VAGDGRPHRACRHPALRRRPGGAAPARGRPRVRSAQRRHDVTCRRRTCCTPNASSCHADCTNSSWRRPPVSMSKRLIEAARTRAGSLGDVMTMSSSGRFAWNRIVETGPNRGPSGDAPARRAAENHPPTRSSNANPAPPVTAAGLTRSASLLEAIAPIDETTGPGGRRAQAAFFRHVCLLPTRLRSRRIARVARCRPSRELRLPIRVRGSPWRTRRLCPSRCSRSRGRCRSGGRRGASAVA
jgi:hypothetical protein